MRQIAVEGEPRRDVSGNSKVCPESSKHDKSENTAAPTAAGDKRPADEVSEEQDSERAEGRTNP